MLQIINIGKNKTQINTDSMQLYVSYKTPVAAQVFYNGKFGKTNGFYITDEFWSVTTSRHINVWLSSYGLTKEDCTVKPQAFFDNLLLDNGITL